jgi:uncharacterized membrane protein YhaH (DUF805 family)
MNPYLLINLLIVIPSAVWKSRSVLFSFNGRVSRKVYWSALVFVHLGLALIFSGIVVGLVEAATLDRGASELTYEIWAFTLVAVLVAGPIIMSATAVAVKRLHDRNRTGWWLLSSYLPAIVGIGIANWPVVQESIRTLVGTLVVLPSLVWAFIDLGCIRGTIGPNRYGDDPIVCPQKSSGQ